MLEPEKAEFFPKVIGSVALAKPVVSSLGFAKLHRYAGSL